MSNTSIKPVTINHSYTVTMKVIFILQGGTESASDMLSDCLMLHCIYTKMHNVK